MNNHFLPTEVSELVEFLVARLECLLWGLRGLERKVNKQKLWSVAPKKGPNCLLKINVKKKALWLKNKDQKHLLQFLSSPNNWKMEVIAERGKIAEIDLTKEF